MIAGSVARRYARALFEIGRDRDAVDAQGDELSRVAAAVRASEDLRKMLSNPVFGGAQRKAALRAVTDRLGVSPSVRSLLMLLVDRGRVTSLAAVEREYRALADRAAGRARAEVVSARPLAEDVAARLRERLERATGHRILLDHRVDADLIGGLQVKVGSTLYDGSVRARLAELRKSLGAR